jgi:hypothetical protein
MPGPDVPPYNSFHPEGLWGSHVSRGIGYDHRRSWTAEAVAAAKAAKEAEEAKFYDNLSQHRSCHDDSYHPSNEGGKKRKNTIKQRKSRNGRKSRRH